MLSFISINQAKLPSIPAMHVEGPFQASELHTRLLANATKMRKAMGAIMQAFAGFGRLFSSPLPDRKSVRKQYPRVVWQSFFPSAPVSLNSERNTIGHTTVISNASYCEREAHANNVYMHLLF